MQKALFALNFVLVLAILAAGLDILVEQSTLTRRVSTVAQRIERLEQIETSTPAPTLDPAIPRIEPTRPSQIEIPSIGVFANVIDVGVTPDNAMDVPEDTSTVGWYKHGKKPGEVGGAIMTAHYDTPTGKPAIFNSLRNVKEGDLIFVRMENGEEIFFQVQDLISEPTATFPTELIYGDIEDKQLILITCDGVWNPIERSYSKRLVVFATLWENRTVSPSS